ncbi:DUF2934 domain-containing protein [Hydrogenophaga sp.]|uniref:DUF2934 domain-containing protein n=1 Tax=Hydrogenophaga sp. TaxID=1904254 RepID=UPI0025C27273|nr:DUF2934 domain-containing protein [Hydrogenophaga sp.]
MTPSVSKQASTEANAVLPPTEADPSTVSGALIDPAHRYLMIAEAAFFIAEARGFTPSQEFDDWIAAEREIDQRLTNSDH